MGKRIWRCFYVVLAVALLVVLLGAAPSQGPEMGGPPIHFQIINPEAIPRGACATLVWGLPPDIQGDWPMFLDGRQVERMGEMRVCPEETTTYHLNDTNSGNNTYKETTPPPP